ncbi:hypothetical protein PCYB_001830, partial [Plasmodium cynomolgi strain B]
GELENGEKSRPQRVILEEQKDLKSVANTIESKGEASEYISTHHSSITVPVDTSIQHSSPDSYETQELDMHKGVDSSHKSSTQYSHSDNTWQMSDSRGNSPQHNLSGDQDLDGKTHIENIPAKDIPGSQAHGDQALAMKTADASPIAQIEPVSEEQIDKNSISRSTVIVNTENITSDNVDTVTVDI